VAAQHVQHVQHQSPQLVHPQGASVLSWVVAVFLVVSLLQLVVDHVVVLISS
jgi:hypothetical protein